MEINKQLFEDVLSGKLKGTFVLENTRRVSSKELRLSNDLNTNYPYYLNNDSYTNYGRYNIGCPGTLDIVDFIPDTNMKENKLTIEIPDNKVVDWDESKKQNKIVLKDKQLTYKDVCKKLFEKRMYFIDKCGTICLYGPANVTDPNNAPTEHQLECILAKNKLANVAVYLNNGWKPGETNEGHFNAWVIFMTPTKNYIGYVKIDNCANNSNVLFKSKEIAQQAIEILGEETVKLALEPLGI